MPDSVGNLANLEHIYLRSNRLTSVPDSIGDLPRMQRLSVDPDDAGTAPVPAQIAAWFFNRPIYFPG